MNPNLKIGGGVPKRLIDACRKSGAVSEVYAEDNGMSDDGKPDFWVMLDRHVHPLNPGCHSLHETSVPLLCAMIRQLVPCKCSDCLTVR